MIPISSPGRSIHSQRGEIKAAIDRVLRSGWLVLGPENEALSGEMSEYLGCAESILVGNGTDALEIALLSIGVKPDDSVICVANAGGYASTAITKIGATPIYVDISESDLEMDINGPLGLEVAIDSAVLRPAAIIVTHLFGNAASIERAVEVAEKHHIPIVEDCAQCFGAEIDGKKLGTYGKVATTSFYPTKNLGALGDGGAIFTSDLEVAKAARALRQYGWSDRYNSVIAGARNSRLDEIQAAILRLRLREIDQKNQTRLNIYRRYVEASSANQQIDFPHANGRAFVGHLALLRSDNRNSVRDFMKVRGISTDIHYPVPDHHQLPWAQFSQRALTVTEQEVSRILTIPLFPEMEEPEIQILEDALSQVGKAG